MVFIAIAQFGTNSTMAKLNELVTQRTNNEHSMMRKKMPKRNDFWKDKDWKQRKNHFGVSFASTERKIRRKPLVRESLDDIMFCIFRFTNLGGSGVYYR